MPFLTRHSLSLLAAAVVASCTTVPAEERAAACRATDWFTYGQNDGLLGVAASERDKKFDDCAELGDPADVTAYNAGRVEGLRSYCTLENGYDVGYEGRRYRKVCPPEQEIAFLQGFEQGRKERPRQIYPTYGFSIGFGSFHNSYLGSNFGYHRHRHHRRSSSDGE